MTYGGRPRREDEKPDSPFGKVLKEHLRRIEDFTQAELARESFNSVPGQQCSCQSPQDTPHDPPCFTGESAVPCRATRQRA